MNRENSCPYSTSQNTKQEQLVTPSPESKKVNDILRFKDAYEMWRYRRELSITSYEVDDSLLKEVYTLWVDYLTPKSKYILYKACTWKIVEEVYEKVMKKIKAKLIMEKQLWTGDFIVWYGEIKYIKQKKSTHKKIYHIKKIISDKLSEYFRQEIMYIYDKSRISQKFNRTPDLPTIVLLILDKLAGYDWIKQEINQIKIKNLDICEWSYEKLPIGEIESCLNVNILWMQSAIYMCYRLVYYFIINNLENECTSDKLKKCVKNSFSTFISMAQCNMFNDEVQDIDNESDYLQYDKEKNMFRFCASKKDYKNHYEEKPLNNPHSFKKCALMYKKWETEKNALLDFVNMVFELYILYLERTNILKK